MHKGGGGGSTLADLRTAVAAETAANEAMRKELSSQLGTSYCADDFLCYPPCNVLPAAVVAGSNPLQGADPAWHSARASRLTASHFAEALGISPWSTPQTLYRYYTEPSLRESWTGNAATEHGCQSESLALRAYERLTGHAVEQTGFHVHPDHSWLGASPDGLVGDDGLIEIKCPVRQLPDSIPVHYMSQVQGQLEITGRGWCDFFCMRGDEAVLWRVVRSPSYWSWAWPGLSQFWAVTSAELGAEAIDAQVGGQVANSVCVQSRMLFRGTVVDRLPLPSF
jgi:putative phage-type endonuclease